MPRAGHPRSPRNSGHLRRFPPHIPAAPLHSCRSPVPRSTSPLRSFLPRFSGKTKSYRPPQTWDCTSSLPMRFAALLFRHGSTPTCPSFPPTSVTIFHPCSMAIPSSSVGPFVICSGSPFGNRSLQIWNLPPLLVLMYIHFPSGDHVPVVHWASAGPTSRPWSFPSNGTNRHGVIFPCEFICTTNTHFPSGD